MNLPVLEGFVRVCGVTYTNEISNSQLMACDQTNTLSSSVVVDATLTSSLNNNSNCSSSSSNIDNTKTDRSNGNNDNSYSVTSPTGSLQSIKTYDLPVLHGYLQHLQNGSSFLPKTTVATTTTATTNATATATATMASTLYSAASSVIDSVSSHTDINHDNKYTYYHYHSYNIV
jgi:hypothetical protein